MNRMRWMVLVGPLLAVWLPLGQPAQAEGRPAVLRVSDTRAVGELADDHLSFAEAIRLVAGDIGLADLSPEERQRVHGDVGAAAGRIIELPVAGTILSDAPLPVLRGIEDTVIDGRGARLEATADSGGTGVAVASSRLTIRRLGLIGFTDGITIRPQGVSDISDVILDELELVSVGSGVNIVASTTDGSVGTIRRVAVSRSRIEGVAGGAWGESLVGVNVVGQAGPTAGMVEEVTIAGNRFGGHMLERVQLVGIQGVGTLSLTGATAAPQLRNVTVAGNTFTTCPDPCVLAYAALSVGGQIAGAAIEGLRITDNDMPVDGSGVVVIGGYTLAAGITDDSVVRDVVIDGNRIRPRTTEAAGRCVGIALVGAWTDFHAGAASNGRVEEVVVEENVLRGCYRGLVIAGTYAWEQIGGHVRDSVAAGVVVRRNRFESNTLAVQATGAALEYARLWGRSPTNVQAAAAVLSGNDVRDVLVEHNEMRSNGTALLVAGAAIVDTNGHVVTENSAVRVRTRHNRGEGNQRGCLVSGEYRERSLGISLGNVAVDVRC